MNIFSNIGITELVVILLLALLVVGPERLPEMARKLAQTLRDVRQAYENLTKDLGPELMSLQQTTREIRDSVDSVRSIPKDVVGSVVKAADLEDTVKDLKEVEKSLQQAGKSVAQAGEMVQKPLDEAVESARAAVQPATAKAPAAGTSGDADNATAEDAAVTTDAATSVEESEERPASPSSGEGGPETDV